MPICKNLVQNKCNKIFLPNGDPRHQDSAQHSSGIRTLRIETVTESDTQLLLNPSSTSTISSVAMCSR